MYNFAWSLKVLAIATFRKKKGLVSFRTIKIVEYDSLLLLDWKKLGRGSLAGCILHAKYITVLVCFIMWGILYLDEVCCRFLPLR